MRDAMPGPATPPRSKENRVRGAMRRHGAAIQAWFDAHPPACTVSVGETDQGRQITYQEGWDALANPPGSDPHFHATLTLQAILPETQHLPGNSLVERVVRALAEADPTDCGTYVDWLVRTWLAQHWREEDAPRLRDDLMLFDRNRHRLVGDGERDIYRYPTPQALLRAIRPFRAQVTGDVQRDRPDMLDPPQARLIRDDAAFRVVMPLTAEAAIFWGDGSEWCISWGGGKNSRYPGRKNRFQDYAAQGPFLIVRRHADNSLWAMHLVGGSKGFDFWDQDDAKVPDALEKLLSSEWEGLLDEAVLSELDPRAAIVRKLVVLPKARQQRILKVASTWVQVDSQEWLDAVEGDRALGIAVFPRLVAHLRDASVAERMMAIEADASVIALLQDPTPSERLYALKQVPTVIRILPSITADERMVALQAAPSLAYELAPLTVEEQAAVVRMRPDMADAFLPQHLMPISPAGGDHAEHA